MALNLAPAPDSIQPVLEYGLVLPGASSCPRVRTARGTCLAEQALSCLVEPQPGDIVLVAADAAGGCFVLAVLRRGRAETPTDLVLSGPARLRVREGPLTITADGGLTLASPASVACVSRKVSVSADLGRVRIGRLRYIGRLLRSKVLRIRTVAADVDQVFRRLVQRARNSHRYIQDLDETQARSSRLLAEDLITMHSRNTILMSEEHVTVNAEQIQLG